MLVLLPLHHTSNLMGDQPNLRLLYVPCSGQDCSAEQIESIKAIVSGAMLCNDSHLNHTVGPDGKEVWTPNGAPTEVRSTQ